METLNTIIEEEEEEFDALFPCIDPTCDQNGTAITGSPEEPETMQCEYCYRERLPLKELFTTAKQRAWKESRIDWLRSEIERLEGMEWVQEEIGGKVCIHRKNNFATASTSKWSRAENSILTSIITRYKEELLELEKGV